MNDLYKKRLVAIRRYLSGEKPVEIYSSLGYSSGWFFKWKKRYELYGLDGLKDLSKAPKCQANATPKAIESTIVSMRKLREQREQEATRYALIGAYAIHEELKELGYNPPSVRTVHRILARNGLITSQSEDKPARCLIESHYPCIEITKPGQLQQLDLVGPRYLKGSGQKYYFYNLKDVCSLRVAIQTGKDHKAISVVKAVISAWQRMGIPTILQHDNGLEFRGSNRYPHSAGLLTKLCLLLGVETLFIPPRQPYRNGSIENLNGLFQRLVLRSQTLNTFAQLQEETYKFECAANTQHHHFPLNGCTSQGYEEKVGFTPNLLTKNFKFKQSFKFKQTPQGKVSFICRIRKSGKITIANEKFLIDPKLARQYVYATIFVKEQKLKIFYHNEIIKQFHYDLKC